MLAFQAKTLNCKAVRLSRDQQGRTRANMSTFQPMVTFQWQEHTNGHTDPTCRKTREKNTPVKP